MTNAEMYKKVFGLEVDYFMCPTENCVFCPLYKKCSDDSTYDWWNLEYNRGEENGK